MVQAQQLTMPGVIYIKLANDGQYTIKDRRLTVPESMAPGIRALSAYGWWSRVHTLPAERLQELRYTAEKNLKRKLFDPASEFHFHLYHPAHLDMVMEMAASMHGIDKVLRIPVPVNAQAPDYTGNQQYVHGTTAGINADSVYLVYNNRGGGIKVCDIEYDYNHTHADLPLVTLLGDPIANPFPDDHHGTAVLGEIASLNNGEGTTGIAADCQLFFAAACTMPDTLYDLSAPILTATATFSPGDILLLEQQINGPNVDTGTHTTQKGLVPVEWFEPFYNAILTATGNGIIVVEAAGNGQENLDAPAYSTGNGGHYPFLPGNNSGAIIIGAGGAGFQNGGQAVRSRMWYSNYGSRLDVQGNGERVATTGYGDSYATEGYNKYYTLGFGGTSSASPIVTGAVALLQSVYKSKSGGAVLTPMQVRSLLVSEGKPQTDGVYPAATYPIGPLPNVYASIRKAISTLSAGTIKSSAGISVYPNPAKGSFTITVPGNNGANVRISNAVGSVVGTYTLDKTSNGRLSVDMADKATGIYLIQVTNNTGTEVVRMVLE